jgi:hypothetical protein
MVFNQKFTHFLGVLWNFFRVIGWKIGGAIIVFSIIFIRFLRPRASGFIDFSYSTNKVYFYSILIISFSISLIILIGLQIYFLYHLFIKKDNEQPLNEQAVNKTNLFYKMQNILIDKFIKFRDVYQKMLDSFYLPFYRLTMHPDFIQRHLDFLYLILKYTVRKAKIIMHIFYFLPPCIISLTYLIELVFYNCFTYFPYSIFLMIFPLIIRIYLYHLGLFCPETQNYVEQIVTLKDRSNDNNYYEWAEGFNEEYKSDELLYVACKNHQRIRLLTEYFNGLRKIIFFAYARLIYPPFSLLCWIISFSYILYRILN